MSGHSKWDNIKHRKGAQDAARSKLFAKLSKEIMVAAAKGGVDVASNSSLRLAISKAKAKSMPKKNIEAAISKATRTADASHYKEISYGGNVAGVSFLVVYLSSNDNKVAATVQSVFKRANGSVVGAASVAYIFDRKGVLEVPKNGRDADEIMMLSLEAGAEDFQSQDNSFFIYTQPSNFVAVKENLEKKGINDFETAEVRHEPNQKIKLPKEKTLKILNFISKLEEDDDIQGVFHNLDLS